MKEGGVWGWGCKLDYKPDKSQPHLISAERNMNCVINEMLEEATAAAADHQGMDGWMDVFSTTHVHTHTHLNVIS